MTPQGSVRRGLHLERLEDRQLLTSITVDGTKSDDTLIIIATEANSGTYQLNDGPEVAFSEIESFVFGAGDGSDRLDIHNPPEGAFAPVNGVTYSGGSGADRLSVMGGSVRRAMHSVGQPSAPSRTKIFYDGNVALVTRDVETTEDWVAAETRNFSGHWRQLPHQFFSIDEGHAISWGDGFETLFAEPSEHLTIETVELIVDDVSVGVNSQLNGNIRVDGRFDVAGNLGISSNATTVDGELHVGGSFSLDALYGQINGPIEVAGNALQPLGLVDLHADEIRFGPAGAIIARGEGNVDLRGSITMEDGAIIDGGSSDVSLRVSTVSDRPDIQVAHVTTTGHVTIQASGAGAGNSGDIIDAGDTHVDIVAASAYLGGRSVGKGSPLETDVQFLEGSAGEFQVDNISDLVLGDVDGTVSIAADNLRIAGEVTARGPDAELSLVYGDSLQLDSTGRIQKRQSEKNTSIEIRPKDATADHQVQLLGRIESDRVDINGGDGNDIFVIGQTNRDDLIDVRELIVQGLAGDDTFHLIPSRTADFRVEGGPGSDVLVVHPAGATSTVLPDKVVFSDGFRDLTYSDTIVRIEDQSITVDGTDADDILTIIATGANSGTYQLDSGPTLSFSGIESFTFNAGGGADRLEINNPSEGAFLPTSGLDYSGGAGADRLVILGGTVQSIAHSIVKAGRPPTQRYEISYNDKLAVIMTDVETIEDSVSAETRILKGEVNRLSSDNGGHAIAWDDGLMTLSSDPTIELAIENPEYSAGTVVKDGVTVGGSLRVDTRARLTIDGRVEVSGDVNLVGYEPGITLTRAGSIIAPGEGSVSLAAHCGGITMRDGAIIDGGSGDVFLWAPCSDQVRLGHVTTSGEVRISAYGGVSDGGDTHIDIVASSARLDSDFGNIGSSSDAVETDVQFLAGESNMEDFSVHNVSNLVLGDVRAGDSCHIVADNLRIAGQVRGGNLLRLVFGETLQLDSTGRVASWPWDPGGNTSLEIQPADVTADHQIQLMGSMRGDRGGRVEILGGEGHDTIVIRPPDGDDLIDVGELIVQGLGGDDTFNVIPLTRTDARIEGGQGNDAVVVHAFGVGSTVLPDKVVFSDGFRDILYSGAEVSIENRLAGDADDDGEVQFNDFVALANNFGRTDAAWGDGDFDRDGDVDFFDFTLLANNFGHSRQPVPLATAVVPDDSPPVEVLAASDAQVDALFGRLDDEFAGLLI